MHARRPRRRGLNLIAGNTLGLCIGTRGVWCSRRVKTRSQMMLGIRPWRRRPPPLYSLRRFIVSAYEMRRYGAKMMYLHGVIHACCRRLYSLLHSHTPASQALNYARTKKHPSRCVAWEWRCSGRFCCRSLYTCAEFFIPLRSKFPFSSSLNIFYMNTKCDLFF